jgi:Cysteine-rich CPCC
MLRNTQNKMKLISILLLSFFSSCGQTQNKSKIESSKVEDNLTNKQIEKMFDPTKLTESDNNILADFFQRRKLFDTYIKNEKLKQLTCPGCGYPTLTERGSYDICDVCNWEDHNQDDREADKVWGGPNGSLSLTENRINIGKLLIHNSTTQNSKINLDPKYVLETIKFYRDKKAEIRRRMTGDETMENPIWAEWKQIEKDLQIALCRDKLN